MVLRRICFSILISVFLFSCKQNEQKNYTSYVNPLIGSTYSKVITKGFNARPVDFGQTIPAVGTPFGMTQWTPQINNVEDSCEAPYYSTFLNHQGIRATHWLNGSCSSDYGSITFMPINGTFYHTPSQRRSNFDFETMERTPAYLSVQLHRYLIQSEVTATKRAGFLRFSWLDPDNPAVIIDINSKQGMGYIKIDPENNEIVGYNPVYLNKKGVESPAGFSGYFVAKFDHPFKKYGISNGHDYEDGLKEGKEIKDLGAYVFFELEENTTVQVKVGTSFTSIENARLNLETEIPGWDFTNVRNSTNQNWNNLLGKIDIEGGKEEDKIQFYSALYRCLLQPRLFNDVDGSYPGFNNSGIKKTTGHDYYVDFLSREIFQAQMPLISLIAPETYEDIINSLILKAEQGGHMPLSPLKNSYSTQGVGDFASTLVCEAYLKGFNVDMEKAWPYLRKNAYEPAAGAENEPGTGRPGLKEYLDYGYIPIDSGTGNEVSLTLDYAYNDWCLAQAAKKLGEENDFEDLSVRAENYANVFDPDKGWVCGRFSNDYFTDEFWENEEMPWLRTGTPRQNSWFVPQNAGGLIQLFGGEETFKEKLDNLIATQDYRQGHTSDLFIPYLFNYIGRWDRTQKMVKNILLEEYNPTFGGIPGDDLEGKLSSWYVFSAMGLYPVNPAGNKFQLSSPIFKKITFNLNKKYYPGKKFIITGDAEDTYMIYSKAVLNRKNTNSSITFSDIKKGGRLEFSLSE